MPKGIALKDRCDLEDHTWMMDRSVDAAMPKSVILQVRSSSSKTFRGLISRWTIPAAWAVERPTKLLAMPIRDGDTGEQ